MLGGLAVGAPAAAAGGRQRLGIGQKSGLYWALDPDTGRVVWRTQVGPGSDSGGIMWGSATDGRRVYTAVVNGDREPYTIRSVTGGTSVVTGPGPRSTGDNMYAIDAATGTIRWRHASGGSVVAGAAVVRGTVYWGSGYYFPKGADNDTFSAFSPR